MIFNHVTYYYYYWFFFFLLIFILFCFLRQRIVYVLLSENFEKKISNISHVGNLIFCAVVKLKFISDNQRFINFIINSGTLFTQQYHQSNEK